MTTPVTTYEIIKRIRNEMDIHSPTGLLNDLAELERRLVPIEGEVGEEIERIEHFFSTSWVITDYDYSKGITLIESILKAKDEEIETLKKDIELSNQLMKERSDRFEQEHQAREEADKENRELREKVEFQEKMMWKPKPGEWCRSSCGLFKVRTVFPTSADGNILGESTIRVLEFYKLHPMTDADWATEIAPGIKMMASELENGNIRVEVCGRHFCLIVKDSTTFPDDYAAGLALLANSGVPIKPFKKEQ